MDTIYTYTLAEHIADWQFMANNSDGDYDEDWIDLVYWAIEGQYGYIKLGLMLERIKESRCYRSNRRWYPTFKAFCEQQLGLKLWQGNAHIKAAQLAVGLVNEGFKVIPQNFSQACTLGKKSWAEVKTAWSAIVKKYSPIEITSNKIEQQIDPNWESKQLAKTLKSTNQRAYKIALERGMTIDEYLNDLMDADQEPEEGVAVEQDEDIELDSAEIAVLDDLNIQFAAHTAKKAQPKKTVTEISDDVVTQIDAVFNSILGNIWQPRY